MFEAIDQLLDVFLSSGVPANDLCIYYKGKCVYRRYKGFSDYALTVPMSGKEKYNLYSCSKPITCAAALNLWEKGGFSLEDKLSDYIPSFSEMRVRDENGNIRRAERPILVRHLFEMTSGLGYDVGCESIRRVKEKTGGRCPTVETVSALAEEPLSFEPGERWQYSFSHDVLAALVEVISGERFSDYVRKNIFAPLGMNSSDFAFDYAREDELCAQYTSEGGRRVECGKKILAYKLGDEYESGGAGCVSTVDDYMLFLEALRLGDTILKSETVSLMARNRISPRMKNTDTALNMLKTYGYGLGVRCSMPGCDYTDFGWNGAAGAHMAVDRENEITVYYAQHYLGSPMARIRHLVYPMARDFVLCNSHRL